jgi:hypothetical protein
MTIRVLGLLGVIASMCAASCAQGAPEDVSSEGTATQADQALESTDNASASTGEALESTGEVQQSQEVLNKYLVCYRIAFTTTKFACQYKHKMPADYCTLLAEATARTVCKPLLGVTD